LDEGPVYSAQFLVQGGSCMRLGIGGGGRLLRGGASVGRGGVRGGVGVGPLSVSTGSNLAWSGFGTLFLIVIALMLAAWLVTFAISVLVPALVVLCVLAMAFTLGIVRNGWSARPIFRFSSRSRVPIALSIQVALIAAGVYLAPFFDSESDESLARYKGDKTWGITSHAVLSGWAVATRVLGVLSVVCLFSTFLILVRRVMKRNADAPNDIPVESPLETEVSALGRFTGKVILWLIRRLGKTKRGRPLLEEFHRLRVEEFGNEEAK
jgi:hypothetical protein